MDDDRDATDPPPPIPPEFTGGSVDAGLDALRSRLLDLTARNRLLNFKHAAKSSLRFVHVDLETAFDRLTDEQTLVLEAVPEPPPIVPAMAVPETGQGHPAKPTAADFARSLDWRTEYDLDPKKGELGAETLRVLLYEEALDSVCRRIGSAARTAIEESGTNMLYLAFGFLEWFESDDSQESRLAPLVTVPVALTRGGLKSRTASLQLYGEDIEPNLSLVERMRKDFAIEIPSLDEEEALADYFARLGSAIEGKLRWRIRRYLTLGLLSFGKLLMYRDLGRPKVRDHAIVRELFEGRKSDVLSRAVEYDFDDDREPRIEAPEVVLDADSSQLSALVDALDGKNLVIEGPPGTGKSQTISNLVAAALVAGKSVLFVSDKLAALEVVRRRLDAAGLGMFCLELHSHKTRKHSLLKDLATRIEVAGTFAVPDGFDAHSRTLDGIKATLLQHARFLQQVHQPLNLSLFQLIWMRERLSQSLGASTAIVEGLVVPNAEHMQREDFGRVESRLEVYAKHLEALHSRWSDLSDHPWSWVNTPLSLEGLGRLTRALAQVVRASAALSEVRRSLAESYDIDSGATVGQAAATFDRLGSLPMPPPGCDRDLLESCRQADGRAALQSLVTDTQEAGSTRALVAGHALDEGQTLLSLATAKEEAMSAVSVLTGFGFAGNSLAQVDERLAGTERAQADLLATAEAYGRAASVLGWSLPCTKQSSAALLACIDLLMIAPMDDLHLRDSLFERAGIETVIREAAARASSFTSQWAELDAQYHISVATSIGAAGLRRHAQVIASATLWQRWFGRDYREAAATCRLLARGSAKVKAQKTVQPLLTAAAAIEDREAFQSSARYAASFEHLFHGLETDWNLLDRLAGWYSRVAERLIGLPSPELAAHVKAWLLQASHDELRRVVRQIDTIRSERPRLEGLSDTLASLSPWIPDSPSRLVADISQFLAERHGLIKTAANALKAVRLRPSEALDGVPVIIEAADRHRASVGRIARTLERIPVTAGDLDSIDIAALETTRSFAEEIAGGGWPDRLRDAVLGTDCDEHMKSLLRQVDDGRHHLASLRDQGVIVEELAGVEDWTLPTSEPEARAALGTRSLDAEDELIGWSQWLAARVDVEREGLEELIGPFERREAPTADLLACFKFVLFSNLVRTMLSRHPDAALLSGLTQQELRRQFRKADAEAIRLTRLRAAARIAQRPVPHGNQSGPVKSWTQASLLAHEISKQKRHLPIRQLVRRAGHALQALKPCFLMGPLSVAQYLEPGGLEFDLVVMDEASQLKPEDAVGAIARGGQVVVVGDPKQLPPTSFFDRVMREEDGSDEETAVEEGESILDVACSLYQPVRRLRWHYRSRHQSLIAFSNREFYQGNLLVFPSAFEKHPELGVRYLAVRGTYENRRNPAEASALIEAVLEHMHSRPNESLGVVTLNFEQMELIDELLDVRFKDDPEAQAYLESMQENAEPFFVKNLENVQGDERDVVFISCTYGPDGRGNQHQRFGPITGENGHRRLNVLFTRAKRRVHVFSSLDHDRIDERGKAWGVRVLKHYLKYAQTGYLEASETGHHRTPEPSDFERAVGDVLRQAGHDVTTQVGVAGFFIDLGIRNPVKAGAYLLGIECDGATYHSGRSARDRDRLRQEILESHGWQLHRIWSTDWYHSRQREVKRLFDRVEEALEADAAYREWRERKERQESVQGNLVSLREEIVGAFPDVPPDRCLLRDEVLEVLVTKRPVTRDDWFRVIPLSLRERTEAAQVGRYLQRVLDIIREASE